MDGPANCCPRNCIFSTLFALRFWSLRPHLLTYRNVTHHFGIGRLYWKRSYDCWCPLTAPSYLENAVCRKSLIFKDFFRSPRLYIFGHCDLVFRSTEMLRTILELEDCAVRVKNIFDALKWFRHTFKVRVERDRQKIVFFFGLLGNMFLVIMTLSLGLQKCCAPFWNWQTILKKKGIWLVPQDGSVILKKCGMPKKFIFSVSSALCFRSLWPCL